MNDNIDETFYKNPPLITTSPTLSDKPKSNWQKSTLYSFFPPCSTLQTRRDCLRKPPGCLVLPPSKLKTQFFG